MQFTIPSQDEVRAIHQATLRPLSQVSIFIDDDEARTFLLDHNQVVQAAIEKEARKM